MRYIGSNIETDVTVRLHGDIEAAGNRQNRFETFWPEPQTNLVLLQGTVNAHRNGLARYATHPPTGSDQQDLANFSRLTSKTGRIPANTHVSAHNTRGIRKSELSNGKPSYYIASFVSPAAWRSDSSIELRRLATRAHPVHGVASSSRRHRMSRFLNPTRLCAVMEAS